MGKKSKSKGKRQPPATRDIWQVLIDGVGPGLSADIMNRVGKGDRIEDLAVIAGDASLRTLLPNWSAQGSQLGVEVTTIEVLRTIAARLPLPADWHEQLARPAAPDHVHALCVHKGRADIIELAMRRLSTLPNAGQMTVDAANISDEDLADLLTMGMAKAGKVLTPQQRAELLDVVRAEKAGIIQWAARGAAAGMKKTPTKS